MVKTQVVDGLVLRVHDLRAICRVNLARIERKDQCDNECHHRREGVVSASGGHVGIGDVDGEVWKK